MPGSTYSTNLKIELMTTGENSGTWGDITNTNLGTAFEQAVIGLGNPDYTSDANLTITITNSNASQAARCLVLNVTSAFGSLTQTRELIVPTIQKQYIVQNNTTGGQSITVKTSAGTGITVPNGRKAHLYVNGTDVIQMFDFVNLNGGTIDNMTIGATTASSGKFTTLNASGATTLDGTVALGNAAGDLITVPGTVNSNLIFTDNTYDIGASGATRPRNLFLAGAATVGGNLSVGGTLTLTGGVNLNGNVTVGDTSADTLTINATITSNLIFTDNTYDIGASGATRPRNLFLAGNATIGGAQTLTGALTVDSTTDSSSTVTGSIQTDGGVGIAKALYVGTTANIAGAVTLSGGTANGVLYLNGSKVATSGSALTFDGTTFGVNAGASIGSSTAKTKFYSDSTYNGIFNGASLGSNEAIYMGGGSQFFYAGGVETFRTTSTTLYTASGINVGIGLSNPQAKLDVRDVNKIVDGIGNVFFATTDSQAANLGATLSLGGVYVGTSAYPFAAIAGKKTNSTSTDASGYLAMYTTNPSNTIVERARITSTGDFYTYTSFINQGAGVGVGGYLQITSGTNTSSVIKYGANTGSAPDLVFKNDPSTSVMTLDASGRLLIGGTSTYDFNGQANLVVNGTANLATIVVASVDAGYITFADGTTGTDRYAGNITYSHSSNQMLFGTNGVFSRVCIDSSGNLLVGTTTSLNTANFQVSTGSGASSAPYAAIFNLATSPTSAASTRFDMGFLSGASNYVATSTVLGQVNFMGQANDNGYGGAFINATVTSGGNVARGSGHSVDLLFGTKPNNAEGSSERMRLTSAGSLLLGIASNTTSASNAIQSVGTTQSELRLQTASTGTTVSDGFGIQMWSDSNVYLWNYENSNTIFGTNATERARITLGGYFKASNTGVYNEATGTYHEFRGNSANSYVVITGCTNATPLSEYIQDWRFSAASPNDGNARFWNCEDSTANRAYMRSNGGLSNYQANDTNLSDRREKTNFAPAKSYLDTICAIPVQTFNYIDQNMEEDGGLTLGVVAQDVQAVAPELVTENNWGSKEDPKMRLSIYQTDLQYALMKALQELKAEFDAYKASHP